MSRVLLYLVAMVPMALHAQEAHLNLNDPDVAAIAQLTSDFAHDLADGAFDHLADYYSPAAVYIADGEPPVDRNVGKAVAKRWRKVLGSSTARVVLHVEEVNVSGDIAYERVSYTIATVQRTATSAIPGQEAISHYQLMSHSLDILRKEDGAWRYYRVMTTTSPGDR
jgi:ketosteroid isomerase-like protein